MLRGKCALITGSIAGLGYAIAKGLAAQGCDIVLNGIATADEAAAAREKLDGMLAREGRADLAAACFRFLPDRVRLDLAGWGAEDIFSHS